MPSETDAPFEAFAWNDAGKLTPDRVLQLAGEPKGTAIEASSLDELFATVPSEDKGKFQKLRQAIQAQLSDVEVYKVGDGPERQVYIVGKAKDGRWAGLKTTVVET
jgi:histidine triad (HIT) family protein